LILTNIGKLVICSVLNTNRVHTAIFQLVWQKMKVVFNSTFGFDFDHIDQMDFFLLFFCRHANQQFEF